MQLCTKIAAHQGSSVLGVLFATALLLISGCGESTESTPGLAESAVAANNPAHLQSASTSAKSVTVGSIGGSLRLDDRTGAIYSIELRDGSAFLQGAAVLRGSERGWYDRDQMTSASTMRNPGIGASLGKHLVVITPQADALWIDDTTRVALSDGNIALFEGAGAELSQVGSLSLERYLGPAPLADASQRKALVQGRLTQLLRNSSNLSSAWSN